MIEYLKALGIITIGSFSVVGLIGYLAKHLFEKFLDARIDIYKFTTTDNVKIFNDMLNDQDYKVSIISNKKIDNIEYSSEEITKFINLKTEYDKSINTFGNAIININWENYIE